MGRPIRYTPGEVRGFEERARHMIAHRARRRSPISMPAPKAGFRRFIRREPLGVVLVIAPWNYPYLTAVNAVVPALMAGNAVHPQALAPDAALRRAVRSRRRAAAGLPDGLLQALHMSPRGDGAADRGCPASTHVAFTGSVAGGAAVERAAAGRFIGVGLELGGKDPAYVRADADLAHAVENLVDGAFFNSGQSCCGIERIYVARAPSTTASSRAPSALTRALRARRSDSSRRPRSGRWCARAAADFVRGQIGEAVRAGRAGADRRSALSRASRPGTPYLAPQVLVDVDHAMRVMREESFGPVVGIMKVASDEEAVAPDERQRLRPHRRDLDRRRRGRRSRSASGSRPAPCS